MGTLERLRHIKEKTIEAIRDMEIQERLRYIAEQYVDIVKSGDILKVIVALILVSLLDGLIVFTAVVAIGYPAHYALDVAYSSSIGTMIGGALGFLIVVFIWYWE